MGTYAVKWHAEEETWEPVKIVNVSSNKIAAFGCWNSGGGLTNRMEGECQDGVTDLLSRTPLCDVGAFLILGDNVYKDNSHPKLKLYSASHEAGFRKTPNSY